MKCVNCGAEISEGALFCRNCGTKINVDDNVKSMAGMKAEADVKAGTEYKPETNNEAGAAVVPEPNSTSTSKPAKKKKLLVPILISSIAAVVVAIVVGIVLFFTLNSSKPISDEKAQKVFENVITALKDYNYDEAERLLKGIKLKDDSAYTETFEELKEITSAKPRIADTDTSNYPSITVSIEVEDDQIEYKKEDFEVLSEDYDVASVSRLVKEGKIYKVTYTATEDEGGRNIEDKIVFIKYKSIDFFLTFDYISEYVTDADISFVTSNVENYPEISVFLKVVDEYGNPIDNLTKDSFTVREYLDIDDYLERDVIYAAKVDEKDALNVSLAIDRSDSISDENMVKIKNATNTFLSKLQFNSGDKAEIVAFESTVMQMCLFTNNKDNLMNGVNSMYPYGLTACYDAIVTSIHNASVQSGARCVIVFTDGYDNESVNTVDSVIRLANEKSVPVYTIGVGSNLREADLRRIANSTGGTYHHIDDISSMAQIYEEIYKEQKNLYHVKYVSDTSIPQDAERRIIVSVTGSGYRGSCDKVYTPVTPVVIGSHSSRYEVIKADVTWEEANRICIEKGGHLATITSKEEEDKIIEVAENAKLYRLWIGGYTTNNQYDEAVGHWVMGEPFVYQNWFSEDEPSRFDSDNAAEFYLMLWQIDGRWSWNDQRNDLINSPFASTYEGKMGYVIEYEN